MFAQSPASPAALASLPGVSVLFSDKSRPRSGLPGEGGGWAWQLEPLSLRGAAAAPPPLGTQMGFIQQTNPLPPSPATQARGPRPHRGKGVVTGAGEDITTDEFSSPRFSSRSSRAQALVLDFPPYLHPEFPATVLHFLSLDSCCSRVAQIQ